MESHDQFVVVAVVVVVDVDVVVRMKERCSQVRGHQAKGGRARKYS